MTRRGNRSPVSERNVEAIIRRYPYSILLFSFGVLALLEGIRLGNAFRSESFLAGPGGYLSIVGGTLLLFAVLEAARLTRRKDPEAGDPFPEGRAGGSAGESARKSGAARSKMVKSFALTAGFILLIEPLGFTLASLIYLTAILRLLGNSVRVTAATIGAIFAILHFGAPAIGLSLPKGVLGF